MSRFERMEMIEGRGNGWKVRLDYEPKHVLRDGELYRCEMLNDDNLYEMEVVEFCCYDGHSHAIVCLASGKTRRVEITDIDPEPYKGKLP